MKRKGYVLIEVLAVAAIFSLGLGMVVAKTGENQERLQQQQLNLAVQKFMMEARRVQQHNMYVKSDDRLKIVVTKGENYYGVGHEGGVLTSYYFADEGCGGVVFDSSAEILFSTLGSVNDSTYIELKHKDNENVKVILNLQPITGRIERAAELRSATNE